MKPFEIFRPKPHFHRLFGGVIMATLLSAWLAWLVFVSCGKLVQHQKLKEEITRLGGLVLHYDEVLTMSARMAAATGDSKWEARYRRFEPALDEVIKKLLSLYTVEIHSARETDAANAKLVKMENQAFQRLREGRQAEASKLLVSREYERQKEIYAGGMAELNASISAAAAKIWEKNRDSVSRLRIALVVALLLSLAGWIHVFRAMRRWNQDLRQANENLDRTVEAQAGSLVNASKMAALGEMAGGIAHEINTPLAVISNTAAQMSELLTDDTLDRAMLSEMASKIGKTGRRIAKIIQGLRSISRDGSGDGFQAIRVSGMIDGTVQLCQERFTHRKVRLTVDDQSRGAKINGRETEFSQVLLSLLNNAYDAVSESDERWVEIKAFEEAGWVSIAVTDSGKGIPVALQEKIFQPFFTTKEIGKGIGLGLSIARGIVQNHGGELTFDTVNSQTRFVLRLPRQEDVQLSFPQGLFESIS